MLLGKVGGRVIKRIKRTRGIRDHELDDAGDPRQLGLLR
jgi:hypothetical protein